MGVYFETEYATSVKDILPHVAAGPVEFLPGCPCTGKRCFQDTLLSRRLHWLHLTSPMTFWTPAVNRAQIDQGCRSGACQSVTTNSPELDLAVSLAPHSPLWWCPWREATSGQLHCSPHVDTNNPLWKWLTRGSLSSNLPPTALLCFRPQAKRFQLLMDLNYSTDCSILPSSPALRSTVHETFCTHVVSMWWETNAMSVTRMASQWFCSIFCVLSTAETFTFFAISYTRHTTWPNRMAFWHKQ